MMWAPTKIEAFLFKPIVVYFLSTHVNGAMARKKRWNEMTETSTFSLNKYLLYTRKGLQHYIHINKSMYLKANKSGVLNNWILNQIDDIGNLIKWVEGYC